MAFLAGPWPARITWGLLPLLLGPALGDALGEHSLAVARTASGLAWVTWAGVLVAVVLPTTVSLTALRIATPAALGGGELGRDHRRRRRWPAAVAVGGAALAVVAAFSPLTGDVFIDGSALRRRAPVRAPRARPRSSSARCRSPASAPSPAPIAGPLLLAAEQWVAGAARAGDRAPDRRGRRSGPCTGWPGGGWCFVPAGLVLHDPHALVEPVLFPRAMIRAARAGRGRRPTRIAGTSPQAALGLALELELVEPAVISPRRPTARCRWSR